MRRHSANNAGVVVVEVERIDVLVLLRRVLGVRDRAIGARREPLGVLGDPGMVGGGVDGEVQRDLKSVTLCLGDEGVEVRDGAQVRVDGVMAAGRGADRPGNAGVVRSGIEGVVGALAIAEPDGVHRREIDDVEAHGCDLGQAYGRGGERARLPAAVRLLHCPDGAREELVPGAVEGALTLDAQWVLVRPGDQVAYGLARQHLRSRRRRSPPRAVPSPAASRPAAP